MKLHTKEHGKNDLLFDNRIVFKQFPTIDSEYEYFPDGVETYALFGYDYRIQTYSHLIYHFSVIRWLNKELDYETFLEVCDFITTKWSVYDDIDYDYINNIFIEVSKPTPIIRKVIYSNKCKLTTTERRQLANNLTKNKGITKDIIDATKQLLLDSGIKATNKAVANALEVSISTIKRNKRIISSKMS